MVVLCVKIDELLKAAPPSLCLITTSPVPLMPDQQRMYAEKDSCIPFSLSLSILCLCLCLVPPQNRTCRSVCWNNKKEDPLFLFLVVEKGPASDSDYRKSDRHGEGSAGGFLFASPHFVNKGKTKKKGLHLPRLHSNMESLKNKEGMCHPTALENTKPISTRTVMTRPITIRQRFLKIRDPSS